MANLFERWRWKAKEVYLVHQFLTHQPGATDRLIQFLAQERPEPFVQVNSSNYRSAGNYIRVCDDIWGYEIHVGLGVVPLLQPSGSWETYGIKAAEATALIEAILSNVRGSVPFRHNLHPVGLNKVWPGLAYWLSALAMLLILILGGFLLGWVYGTSH